MNIRFQTFTIVGLLIISLTSCSQPKTSNNIWTIISIHNDEAYFYKGELKDKSQVEQINIWDSIQIEKLTREVNLLNQKGDSVILVLKPTEEGGEWIYLQQLAGKIGLGERFGFVFLTEKEKKWFGLHDFDFTPPEPVVVQTPTSVTTQTLPEDNAFLIEIRKDSSVWYQVISKVIKMSPQKINMPITKNLQEIIADYEKSATDGPKKYLIKANSNSTKYNEFEQVIEALKANNIYKFNLVTAINE